MLRTVILFAMFPHFAQEFQGRVLIRSDHHFGQRRCFFPHGNLQAGHRSGFDIIPLREITDGGEDQLCFGLHIHTQGVCSALIGRSADLRTPEMDVYIRDGLAGSFVDYFANDNRFDSRNDWSTEYRVQNAEYYFKLAG